MPAANKSYIGKGIVYVANDDGILVDRGNVTAFSYTAEEETISLPNFRNTSGGNYNSVSRLTAVNVSMTFSDFSADNYATGLRAGVTAVTSGVITDEAQTTPADVSKDFLLPTDNVIDITAAVTVTGYTEGTDFTKAGAGIVVLASGTIPASTALAITYTKKAVDSIQTFINAAIDRRVVFDGLNEAQSDAPTVIEIHKFKPGLAEEAQFLGTEFGEIVLPGEALLDASITGTGLSQYLQIKAA